MLISWRQANVVIDQRGRARLTEYGLAPITSGPSFTTIATPDGVRNSRWLAPEIIDPFRKGNRMLVMESKAADVFAFGMFAVEVFTGKIPFEEQRNEAVVLHLWEGGRPELPGDAQAVGLTGETWNLLESCWQQNPRKRPTMREVVGRWQKFVGNSNDVIPECVQIILVVRTPSSVPFSTAYDRPREPQPMAGPTRPRAKTEAPKPPQNSERARTRSEVVQTRWRSEVVRPLMSSETVRPRTSSEAVQSGTKPEVTQRVPKSVVPPRPQSLDPPCESVFPRGY